MYMNSLLENSIDNEMISHNKHSMDAMYNAFPSLQHACCNFSENTSNHAGPFTKAGEKDGSAESESDALSGLILGSC